MVDIKNFDFVEYHENCLKEMPIDMLEKAVRFLVKWVNDEDKKLIREAYVKDPATWWAGYHFGWGMDTRNALRSEAKLDDGLLPKKNWDDYYIPCVEIALGLRETTLPIHLDEILEEAKRETEKKSYRRIVVG
jgi:hypothetical protein